jgi:hypothetical protein
MSGAEPSLIASFEDAMRTLGYLPGKNIHLELGTNPGWKNPRPLASMCRSSNTCAQVCVTRR